MGCRIAFSIAARSSWRSKKAASVNCNFHRADCAYSARQSSFCQWNVPGSKECGHPRARSVIFLTILLRYYLHRNGSRELEMPTDAKKRTLIREMLRMSAGDISMLDALVQDPEAQTATMPGTANDRLWSKMAEWGWMVETPSPLPNTKTFGLTPVGKLGLPIFMDAFHQENRRNSAVTAIYNRLIQEIPPLIIKPVLEAGGDSTDVGIMVLGIIHAIRRAVRPEMQIHFMSDLLRALQSWQMPGAKS